MFKVEERNGKFHVIDTETNTSWAEHDTEAAASRQAKLCNEIEKETDNDE